MLKLYINGNENGNININKDKFIKPLLEEVENYFFENGYTKESGKKAFNYYDVANWIDGKGNKIKNWKQKMQGVWFKEENKIKGTVNNEFEQLLKEARNDGVRR